MHDKEIYSKDKINDPLFKHDGAKWPIIRDTFGFDHLSDIKNGVFSTLLNKVLPKLVRVDSKETEQVLENSTRHSMAPQCKSTLAQSSSLLIHFPVLDARNNLIPSNDHNVTIYDEPRGDDTGVGASVK